MQRERYITILARNVSKNCSQMLNMRRGGGEEKKRNEENERFGVSFIGEGNRSSRKNY
jgi:hypothetical protein